MERMPMRAPLARGVMLGLCIAGLVGCGGGGGGENVRSDPPAAPNTPAPPVAPPVDPPVPTGPTTPTPTAPTDPATPTAPTSPSPITPKAIDAHLYLTNTYAVEHATGAGQGIVFLDSGLMSDDLALKGRIKESVVTVDPARNDVTVDDATGHGTSVAQIAAGSPLGGWPRGLAPGADLYSMRVLDDALADPLAHQDFRVTDDWRQGLAWARTRGRIVDISSSRLQWSDEQTSLDLVASLDVLDRNLLITPTGDGGKTEPAQFAALPQLAARPDLGLDPAALKGRWINVGAVESDDPLTLASYSNACGPTMAYCMVAAGDVVVPDEGHTAETTKLRTVHGTDYAAAQVAGAAALVWERFPTFTEEQVHQVLLTTAKDLGTPGVDPVFGWGMLDAGKASWGPVRFEQDWYVEMTPQNYYTFGNDISGAGGLTVRGGTSGNFASLNLYGAMSYTGPTRVIAAALGVERGLKSSTLTIEGSASVHISGGAVTSDIYVEPGGSLSIGPDSYRPPVVIEGDIHNRGLFWSGEDVVPAALLGNYTQYDSGLWLYNLGDAPTHFNGSAALAGQIWVTGVKQGYLVPGRSVVLIADGGVSGSFTAVAPYYPPSMLLVANIGQNANSVWLDVIRVEVTAATSAGLTPTSLASAQRIDQTLALIDHDLANGQAVASPVLEGAGDFQSVTSVAALDRSVSSLSGELHDMDAAFAMMAIDGNRRVLEARLDDVDSGELRGAWSHRLDATRGWSSFDVSTSGWMLGFDQAGRDGMTVGASLAQTDGDARHSQRHDRERNRQVDAQVYASWSLGEGGYMLGSAAFGHMQRWMTREVWLGETAHRVSSDYAHRYGAIALQSGRRVRFGESTITPYVGVQALQLAREGFSEEGASGFGLASDDASMSATQALTGVRLSRDWAGGSTRWSLSGRVEWQRLLSQTDASIQARFTGLDTWAPIVSDGLDRNVGLFGLGLEGGIGARHTLRFDLDSRHGDGQQWTGAMATWTTAF